MKQQLVHFFSESSKPEGLLRLPDNPSGRLPGIVQGPGWLPGFSGSKIIRTLSSKPHRGQICGSRVRLPRASATARVSAA